MGQNLMNTLDFNKHSSEVIELPTLLGWPCYEGGGTNVLYQIISTVITI